MSESERSLGIEILKIAGKDYSAFVRWIYQTHREIIEKECEKCKRDCPYVSIEGIVSCVLGDLDYSKLYEKFKKNLN